MKIKCLLLVCALMCLFGCLQVNAQSMLVRDLLVLKKSGKDTVVNVGGESYRLKNGILRNVKNVIDTIRRNNNPEEIGTKNSRGHWEVQRKVFSQDRMNELTQLRAAFFMMCICDSIGNVKECFFPLVERAKDIKLEELAAMEKAMKNYKVTYSYKIQGVEYFDIFFPFLFGAFRIRR